MKRKLIIQMLNQWRSNVWMLLQLLIVSSTIFYIGTGLYFNLYNYFSPFGYQTDNTYQIALDQIPKGGTGYIEGISAEQSVDDLMTVIQRIKGMDEVETVAYSRWSGPYLSNYMGSNYYGVSGNDTILIGGNVKKVSPGYIELFGIQSTDGTTQEQLVNILLEGKLLASKEVLDRDPNKKVLKTNPSILKDYTFYNYDSIGYKIGAIVESTKRFDYDATSPVIYQLYAHQDVRSIPEVSVRLKAKTDGKKFMQAVRDKSATYLSEGNVYVQNIQPYESLKERVNSRFNKAVVQNIVCILFLLINIFLGLFGVFWFRTRQRTPEIALRMSFGATSGSIYRRLVSEGLLLLLATLPLTVLVDWILASHELTGDDILNYYGISESPERVLIPIGMTVVVMAIMIIAGISLPAYRAMHTEPAEALKDE